MSIFLWIAILVLIVALFIFIRRIGSPRGDSLTEFPRAKSKKKKKKHFIIKSVRKY